MKLLISLGLCVVACWLLPVTALSADVDVASKNYVLGEGDEIVVRSLRAHEIDDKQYRIETNGEISMPLIGRVEIAGLTIHNAERQIVKSLEAFYLEPDVVISVRVFRSQPVSVMGAVGAPGVHDVRGRKTLMEMLSQAGGLRADAGKVIKITRQNAQGPLPIEGAQPAAGDTTVAQINISSLMGAENPLENILVLPNDVITVPKASMVYVVGEVKHAGGISLGGRDSISALQALALAEGLSVQASAGHTRILRVKGDVQGDPKTAERTEIPVDLGRVLSGKNQDVFLQPDDILFVPNSKAKKITTRAMETALQIGTGILIFH